MTGTAHAKLLLFGEHAAVYGHPAVGLSLPWSLKVVHTPAAHWKLAGVGPYETAVENLVELVGQLAGERGYSVPKPGRLEFTTNIPVGSGFGSSAALCAGLVNLFFPALPLVEKDTLAWLGEGLFHGTPSGIDTALALREGWWSLEASTRPVTASPLPDPGLILVVGSVVRHSNTRSLIASLARRKAEGDRLVVETVEALGNVSAEANSLIVSGRPQDLPPLVERARSGLQTLGLETKTLTAVLDAGLTCPGALAGKLSGAGGGGAFFLLFQSVALAQRALPIIEQAVEPGHWTCRPKLVGPQA